MEFRSRKSRGGFSQRCRLAESKSADDRLGTIGAGGTIGTLGANGSPASASRLSPVEVGLSVVFQSRKAVGWRVVRWERHSHHSLRR